jgi:hypothetical protein
MIKKNIKEDVFYDEETNKDKKAPRKAGEECICDNRYEDNYDEKDCKAEKTVIMKKIASNFRKICIKYSSIDYHDGMY